MILRTYQHRTVNELFQWWTDNADGTPLLVLPTASGKSVIIAEIVRHMFHEWPDYHPRTVILVPSKELAEQNADKLRRLLPTHISVGFISASLGKKQYDTDVIVATIGSIHKHASKLGNIKVVIIDEAHLISVKGAEVGMYRKFLTRLSEICEFRACGLTATPFRGNGVWLTDGDDPLFTGIASNVPLRELLDAGYIAPLIPPEHSVTTKIDASMVGIANGDYKVNELAVVVDHYLNGVAQEATRMASERRKWIAFTPSVANAESFCKSLQSLGIPSVVVCGETDKDERELFIEQFRNGDIRCLITVLALAIGFDVPDVDCIIWIRPTKSPVLYVQGFGRGTRIAPGKTDCLVLDFTDTVERLGPIDLIKGKAARVGGKQDAPFCICPECGGRNVASALDCIHCGAHIKDKVYTVEELRVSRAAIISAQVESSIRDYEIDRVTYAIHKKEGKPNSLRADYWSGIQIAASEWMCFDHEGYARQKARQIWMIRTGSAPPRNTEDAYSRRQEIANPKVITIRKNGKFVEIIDYVF